MINAENKNKKTEDLFLTCYEMADMFKIKVGTIYSWISYNQLPKNIYRKLGKKPLFIKDEVLKWFLAGAELKKRNCKT